MADRDPRGRKPKKQDTAPAALQALELAWRRTNAARIGGTKGRRLLRSINRKVRNA